MEGLPNVDRGFMKRDILVDKVRRGGGERGHGLLKGIFCGCTAFTILVDELGREGEEAGGGGGVGGWYVFKRVPCWACSPLPTPPLPPPLPLPRPSPLQEFNAKLSDFGLAKDGPSGSQSHVSTRVMGTHGYAAPEYILTGAAGGLMGA